jgi:recombination protein RecT
MTTKPPIKKKPAEEREAAIEPAVQTLVKQPRSIRDLIQGPEFLVEISRILPEMIRPERFVRSALTALMRTPDLAQCTKDSLFLALFDLSFYGLEPDGRRAHLIPFRNHKMCVCGHEQEVHRGHECTKCNCRQRRIPVECQLIIDYKGLAELVRRSGDVRNIHADVVYDHDEFDHSYGSGAHLHHVPNPKRDKIVAFYSFVTLKDGMNDHLIMWPEEIEAVRKQSKMPDKGPWLNHYNEMGKKTVFRRQTKWLELSPETNAAIAREDKYAPDSGRATIEATVEQDEPVVKKTLRERLLGPEPEPEPEPEPVTVAVAPAAEPAKQEGEEKW